MENEGGSVDGIEVQTTDTKKIVPKAPMRWQPFAIAGVAILGIVVLTAAAYLAGRRQKDIATPLASASPTPVGTTTPVPSPTATAAILLQDQGVTWLAQPEQLMNLGLFLFPDNYSSGADVIYYKVGTDNGKDVLLASIPPDGPGSNMNILIIDNADGTYDVLEKHASDAIDYQGNLSLPNLASTVKLNKEKSYKSVTNQEKITVNGVTFTQKVGFSTAVFYNDLLKSDESSGLFAPTTAKVFAETPYGTIMDLRYEYASVSDITLNQAYVLRRPNNTIAYYQLAVDFVNDDYVPAVTWADGTVNKDVYRYDNSRSCGRPYNVGVLKDDSLKGFTKAGVTSKGEPVYEATSTDNALLKESYAANLPEGSYYDSATNADVKLSIADYLKNHGVFVYKDSVGRVIPFINSVYGIQAECGKPVVYLYPEKTTKVSVNVDATITVSDPEYGNGWNVTAEPTGALTSADGKKFESLFWEGTGKEYPPVTQGFVVKRADVEKTLRSHLSQLGLNEKESADFMEFWLPKMPTTPYVRLTWFGTRQMDALAPLTVTPKPDSVIRIFLDFQGLEKPVVLPEQKLGHIPRKGFTVVEWGGLLVK
jgi:hypothetical protein